MIEVGERVIRLWVSVSGGMSVCQCQWWDVSVSVSVGGCIAHCHHCLYCNYNNKYWVGRGRGGLHQKAFLILLL